MSTVNVIDSLAIDAGDPVEIALNEFVITITPGLTGEQVLAVLRARDANDMPTILQTIAPHAVMDEVVATLSEFPDEVGRNWWTAVLTAAGIDKVISGEPRAR